MLRGVFTVAGWMIATLPLLFLGLLAELALESGLSLLGVPPFSESQTGDGVLSAVMVSGALVSGAALTVVVGVWILLATIELRIAEAVASRERLSAQDARRLSSTAGQRITVLVELLAGALVLIGGIVAVIGLISGNPELGGRAGALLALVPGGIAVGVVLLLLPTVAAPGSARLDSLRARWPEVASEPMDLARLAAIEWERRDSPADDTTETARSTGHDHRRADGQAGRPLLVRALSAPSLLIAGFVGLILCDALGLEDAWLAAPFLLLALGAAALLLRAVRRSVREGRRWTDATAPGSEAAAPVLQYASRHPAGLGAKLLAVSSGLLLSGTLAITRVPTLPQSTAADLAIALGTAGGAALLLAICLSTHEHLSTRDWRARFLAARPDLDPEWTIDLHHDGLEEIHRWLNG